jgi:hypothetical protein
MVHIAPWWKEQANGTEPRITSLEIRNSIVAASSSAALRIRIERYGSVALYCHALDDKASIAYCTQHIFERRRYFQLPIDTVQIRVGSIFVAIKLNISKVMRNNDIKPSLGSLFIHVKFFRLQCWKWPGLCQAFCRLFLISFERVCSVTTNDPRKGCVSVSLFLGIVNVRFWPFWRIVRSNFEAVHFAEAPRQNNAINLSRIRLVLALAWIVCLHCLSFAAQVMASVRWN